MFYPRRRHLNPNKCEIHLLSSLRYAFSLLYNIKLIKNYTKVFEITQDMSSPAKILPNIEIIYTSAACDACDKYHVWVRKTLRKPCASQTPQMCDAPHMWGVHTCAVRRVRFP